MQGISHTCKKQIYIVVTPIVWWIWIYSQIITNSNCFKATLRNKMTCISYIDIIHQINSMNLKIRTVFSLSFLCMQMLQKMLEIAVLIHWNTEMKLNLQYNFLSWNY